MTIEQIRQQINSPEYDFLKTNPHLGDNIILLGLGGSHSYGTAIESSDIDVRGCATRSARDILIGHDFEQVVNEATDTTIYSLDKLVKLLVSCNPNCIEQLGLKPEHYLYVAPAGQLLLDNAELFLSKRAAYSFGGYAMAQLNRLCNKSGRAVEEVSTNETRSLQKAISAMKRDKQCSDVTVEEIDGVPTIHIHDSFSADSFYKFAQVINNVHSDYHSSSRNTKAQSHGKLAKHQMHLVRLYLMAKDILEDSKIITYREKEHDFLMDIRNGKYLTEDSRPTQEFMDMVGELEQGLKDSIKKSPLPDKPDEERINDLLADINESIVCGGTPVRNMMQEHDDVDR